MFRCFSTFFKVHQLLQLVFFLVVSLYFGSSKMVFSLVQVVELGCLLLFQVAFMCIDFFFLVMCLFVSGCFSFVIG